MRCFLWLHGHFEKKYTRNTATSELNSIVHFPNKISLINSDCTGGVDSNNLSIFQRQKFKLKKDSKMYWSKDREDINAVVQSESANLKRF